MVAKKRKKSKVPAPVPALKTDTAYKAVAFVETYTGRAFYPLQPDPSAVSIIDIAHALSNQCRYSGATNSFYSTAQHCCLLASYTADVLRASVLDCLQILMHDAAEAYLVDIPRPVKQFMPEYRAWDHDINEAIRKWLALDDLAFPVFQDEIDSRIIVDERQQLLSNSGLDWGHDLQPLNIKITPWSPRHAEQQFLVRYAAYTHALFGAHQYVAEGYLPNVRASWHETASDSHIVEDVIEIDLRGGVGRVRLRDPTNRMYVRDPQSGAFPAAKWRWVHGEFTLELPSE